MIFYFIGLVLIWFKFYWLGFLVIYLKFFWFANKYRYKVTVFAGETGSGKTMLATAKALRYIKKGYNVFSTYFIEGAYKLPYNFYDYNFPPDSLLIIDEGQIGFDSRSYAQLTKTGVSNKLKTKLSMHRHYKLDIYVITQNPCEIDAQIRRYCNELFYCNITLLRRIINFQNKKLNMYILPYFQVFQVWKNIDTYERYQQRIDPRFTPRDFGTKTRFKFITKKVFNKYNTEQLDSKSANLPMLDMIRHIDKDSYIEVGL